MGYMIWTVHMNLWNWVRDNDSGCVSIRVILYWKLGNYLFLSFYALKNVKG